LDGKAEIDGDSVDPTPIPCNRILFIFASNWCGEQLKVDFAEVLLMSMYYHLHSIVS